MDSFARDGLRFEVVDRGPAGAETAVLLHGFPQTAASWDLVLPRLVDGGLRVLAPDQRGYSPGARPAGRWAYRMPELVQDVVALLDAAGVERAHVVGHDWGGAVGWALGTARQDRVATLTVLSTPHPAAMLRAMVRGGQALRSWYLAAFQLPWLPERLLAVETPAGRERLVRWLAGAGMPADRARDCVDRLSGPGALTAALNWYRAVPLGSGRDGLAKVTVPTVYVWGAADRFLSRAAAEATRDRVNGPYRFEELLDAGHWLLDRNPATVADLVLRQVREHPAG